MVCRLLSRRCWQKGLGPDEVDTVTGRAMKRPKSATFRTLDLVGLDTFVHVSDNVRENVTDAEEKKAFEVPELLKEMVSQGWLGAKSGQGFFKRVKTEKGKKRSWSWTPKPRLIPSTQKVESALSGTVQTGQNGERATAGAGLCR